MQRFWCNTCEALITAENINLDRMVATCSTCKSEFSIAGAIETPVRGPAPLRQKALRVPLPQHFEMENDETTLRIRYRWRDRKVMAWTYLAALLTLSLGFWVAYPLPELAGCGFFHTLAALGALGYAIVGHINSGYLTVDDSYLTLTHSPFPYPGKQVPRREIKQVYCKEVVLQGEADTGVTQEYALYVVTQSDRHELLLDGLERVEQALYLEQEIETHLMIDDRPVRGEYQPEENRD